MGNRLETLIEKYNVEFQLYKNLDVFDENEIEIIKKRRIEHEHKIMRSNKLLLDYIKYIEYETKLQRIIKKRSKRSKNIARAARFTRNRVIYLYKQAIEIFGNHQDFPQLLKSFVNYTKKIKAYDVTKSVLLQLCIKRPTDIDIFIFSAQVAVKNIDFESASVFLLKGIRLNPGKNNHPLFLSLFETEIAKIDYLNEMAMDIGIENKNEEQYNAALNIFKELHDLDPESEVLNKMICLSKRFEELNKKILNITNRN